MAAILNVCVLGMIASTMGYVAGGGSQGQAGSTSGSFSTSGSTSGYQSFPVPPQQQQGGTGGVVQPFDYNAFLQSYFNNLRQNFAALYAQNIAQQNAAIQAAHESFAAASGGYGFPGGFAAFQQNQGSNSVFPSGPGGQKGPGVQGGQQGPQSGSNYVGASATASLDSQGVHQTASITPENAAHPNVDTRFAGIEPKPGGNYAVFTSSISGSSDIDGKKTSFKKAQTTVNDNGKITTYEVNDP